jgi:translation initiation factor 6
MIALADYNRSPHVGIFCAASDDYAIIPPGAQKSFESVVRDTLGVDIIRTSLLGSSLVSVFCALNNRKIIVPAIAEEKAVLAEHFDVIEISEKYTAVGNLVSMNDRGIVASRYLEGLADAEKVTVANSDLVGSCICAKIGRAHV